MTDLPHVWDGRRWNVWDGASWVPAPLPTPPPPPATSGGAPSAGRARSGIWVALVAGVTAVLAGAGGAALAHTAVSGNGSSPPSAAPDGGTPQATAPQTRVTVSTTFADEVVVASADGEETFEVTTLGWSRDVAAASGTQLTVKAIRHLADTAVLSTVWCRIVKNDRTLDEHRADAGPPQAEANCAITLP